MTDTVSKKPEITDTMTAQDVFNAAYWGITEQGVQGYASNGCTYISPSGKLRCGIGHALTELQARTFVANDFLGLHLYTHDAEMRDFIPPQIAGNMPLCVDIQDAHDGPNDDASFMYIFNEGMRRVALKHGLTVPEGENT
jgi:hypothetical protein